MHMQIVVGLHAHLCNILHTEQGTEVKLTLPTIQPVCLVAALGTTCVVQAAVVVSQRHCLHCNLDHTMNIIIHMHNILAWYYP